MLSSITFMAIPATGYTAGWNFFLASLVLPVPARSLDGLTLRTLKRTP